MCGCEHTWVCARYLWVCQAGVVGFEVVDDALARAGQGDTAHQEHKQHDVREGGCQVHHLEGTQWEGRGGAVDVVTQRQRRQQRQEGNVCNVQKWSNQLKKAALNFKAK